MSNLEPKSPSKGQIYRANSRTVPSVAQRPQEEDDFSFSFLLGVWSQWWKWLIPISILLMVASAAIVAILFKPQFRSDARIEIAEHAPWVVSQDNGPKAMQFVATQIEMLRGPRVLAAVMEDSVIANMPELKKRKKPIEWLADKGLEITPVGQSTFVEVAFEGSHPDASARLVNNVIDNYFAIQNDQKNLRTRKILEALRGNKKTQAATLSLIHI